MPRSGADGGAFVFGTCPARHADGRAHTGAQRPRVRARRSPLGFPAAVGLWGQMRAGCGSRLLLGWFPVASPPWPGLAAELPAVTLGLHEFGTIAESGTYLGDRGDAVVGEEAEEALLDLPGQQRLVVPGDVNLIRPDQTLVIPPPPPVRPRR